MWMTGSVKVKKMAGMHLVVMGWRVMFGEVIGQINSATAPVDKELALGDMVLDPVKVHANGFGARLFDSVIDNAGGIGVASLDGSGQLWMPQFVESGAEPGSSLAGRSTPRWFFTSSCDNYLD